MSLVVFGSQKGSPGATLSALTVAAAWPTLGGRRKLLVEADPDGGVLAVRYGLGREPGLLSLAAAARHGVNRGDVWGFTQQLPGGLAVVVAPERPDQATAALTTSGASLGAWLGALPDVDVIVDVGRLGPSSPALALVGAADLVLMVARPVAEQIQPAAARLTALAAQGLRVGWCLIGETPHSAAEVEAVHGVKVVGVIADDPRGARTLETGAGSTRVRRTPLVRSAAALATALARWLHPDDPQTDEQIAGVAPDTERPDAATSNSPELEGAGRPEVAASSQRLAGDGRGEVAG